MSKEEALLDLLVSINKLQEIKDMVSSATTQFTISELYGGCYFDINKTSKFSDIKKEQYVKSSLNYKDISIYLHEEIKDEMELLSPVLKELYDEFERLRYTLRKFTKLSN